MKSILKGVIKFYCKVISPNFIPSCRYLPTCSQYAADALEIHGAFKGVILALKRILRCHPFGGHGFDPIPQPIEKKHE